MSNLGTIIYGNTTILPGYDTASAGPGHFSVAGNTVLAGSSSIQGTLGITGGATLSSTVSVGGIATFNSTSVHIGSASFSGGIIVTDVTNSTTSNNGALQVKGGLGVLLNSNLGGTLTVTGATSLSNTLSVTGNSTFVGIVNITNTTVTSSNTTGALVVAGGLGVGGNIRSGLGSLYLADDLVLRVDGDGFTYLNSPSNVLNINSSGTFDVLVNNNSSANFNVSGAINVNTSGLQVLNTTDSTGLTDGAFTVAGGASIGLSLHIGGNINGIATKTITIGNVVATNTAQSTSTTTGSFKTAGGIGVAKNAFVGGFLDVASTAATYSAIGNFRLLSSSNGANWIQSGDLSRTADNWTPLKFAPLDSQTSILSINASNVTIDTTTASTSNTTGAFTVAGGVGIATNLFVGGNTTVDGNLSIGGSITGTNPVIFSNTTNSTSVTTGAVIIAGGTGIGKNLYVGGLIVGVNTTESTSSTDGALVIAGGTGIAGALNVGGDSNIGGNLTVTGNITSTSGTVLFPNTTTSTSVSTGAVVIGGGLGLGENIYVGGIARFTNTTASTSVTTGSIVTPGGFGIGGAVYIAGIETITNTTVSTSSSTGALVIGGGVGIGQNLHVAGNSVINGTLSVVGNITGTTGTVRFNNTTDSTSSTIGALVVDGGVGIAKALFVGSADNSTSISTGSVVLSGGLGVASDVFVGGNQTLAGTNPLFTFTNSGLGAPTFNTRSDGTKILLNAIGGATDTDYAFGMETNALWHSVPTNTSTKSFKWYGGTTQAMNLTGLGVLGIYGTSDSSSSTTGSLIVDGGVGIAKALYVGTTLNIATTSFFTGAVTANTNVTVGGIVSVTNNTNSTSLSTGSIHTNGGLGVTLDTNIGGNLNVTGNSTFTGTTATNGIVTINNTTDSTTVGNGSFVTLGGASFTKSVNIGGSVIVAGNTTIGGNLFVSGTTTEISTTIVTTTDNVILVNAGPSGTASSGFSMKRYQYANDDGQGDVINNDNPEVSGTVGTGSSATTIVLGPEASSVDGRYNGAWVLLTGGTGVDQVRRINTYIGATRTATVYTSADQTSLEPVPVEGLDWTTVPDVTSTYAVFSGQYVITVWDEINNEYSLGTTPVNPVSDPNVPIRNRIKVHAGVLKLSEELNVDTITEYTSNTGVTVETVLIKDGALSGVTTINNVLTDITSNVVLPDDDDTVKIDLPGTNTYGSYLVMVSDSTNSGASATFLISGSTARGGSVSRLTNTIGANGEHLTISWIQSEKPKLKFMELPSNGTGANVTYKVRVSGVVN